VLNQSLKAVTTNNCAWYDKKKNKIELASFENIKVLQQSPFLTNKPLFYRMVLAKRKKFPKGFTLNYELTRGCPYACTFCDWNGGFTNKVSRRKNTYQQEIDLFFYLGIAGLYLSDANVGQYDEDVDMLEYIGQQGVKRNRPMLAWGNFSKLNKKNNLKMYHILFKYGIVSGNVMLISMQDIDPQVLANIDRPDVGWPEHLAMAQEIVDTYPQAMVVCQMIYGLPGQTPDSWRNTLRTLTAENVYPYVFINLPLPSSPALYDPNYQEKFNFEYTVSNRIMWQPAGGHERQTYSTKITKSCFSFSQHDLVTMNLLTGIYQAVTKFNIFAQHHELARFDVEKIVDDFLVSPQYRRYNENFYSNWINDNNFFYTISFGGRSDAIADEDLGNQIALDRDFHWWIRKYASPDWIQFLSTADAYRSLSDYFTGINVI
jgi:hypothetical protein